MNFPRLITQYSLHRTTTDRLSSGIDPSDIEKKNRRSGKVAQVQNIPKFMRTMFHADPGWVMIGADWSAIQWALCMWCAGQVNDPPGYHFTLLDRHQRGELDPHSWLAAHLYKSPVPPDRHLEIKDLAPDLRQTCKGFTYGRMFYGTERTLAQETGTPLAEAIIVCQAYDEAFKLKPWWRSVFETLGQRRYVETPHGFRRYFHSPLRFEGWELKSPKPTEVLATVIQGAEAGLAKWVLGQIALDLPEGKDDWREMLTMTHDSFLIQVREERAEEGREWILKHMQAPIPFLDHRTWKAEAKVGRTWAEVG